MRHTGFILGLLLLGGCAPVHYRPAPLSPGKTAEELEGRSLKDPALQEFLARNGQMGPGATWNLDRLTYAAFYFHPDLAVARAHWRAVAAGVETAGARPNPVLSATPGYTMNPASGVIPWIPGVTLDVPIETAGKRGYRQAQARELSGAARLNIAAAAWRVRSNLRASLLDFAAARARAAALGKQIQLQAQIIGLLEQRVQAGSAARMELTPPRIALAKVQGEAADAERQSAEFRVRIAEAIGMPVRGMESVEFDFSLDAGTNLTPEITSAAARQQALLTRADILAALAEYAANEAALRLEIARQYPDVHLSPGYQFDQGEHKWTLGLAVELPVFNRNQGPIAEALARRAELAARFVALQAGVIAEIDRALAALTTARDNLSRQGQWTQLAREQTAAVAALAKTGAADTLEVTGAQFEAGASDLGYLEAEIKWQQAIAQLESAMQQPLAAMVVLGDRAVNENRRKP